MHEMYFELHEFATKRLTEYLKNQIVEILGDSMKVEEVKLTYSPVRGVSEQDIKNNSSLPPIDDPGFKDTNFRSFEERNVIMADDLHTEWEIKATYETANNASETKESNISAELPDKISANNESQKIEGSPGNSRKISGFKKMLNHLTKSRPKIKRGVTSPASLEVLLFNN